MTTVNLTSENFSSTIEGADTILVDFWAEWCGPCRRFGPIFEKAAEENPDVTFAKLDTEANQDIAQALQITSIPTLMVVKGGMLIYREAGALNASQLNELLDQVKKLDIEALKNEAGNASDSESPSTEQQAG